MLRTRLYFLFNSKEIEANVLCHAPAYSDVYQLSANISSNLFFSKGEQSLHVAILENFECVPFSRIQNVHERNLDRKMNVNRFHEDLTNHLLWSGAFQNL